MLQTRHMINVMSLALIINSPLMILSSSETPYTSTKSMDTNPDLLTLKEKIESPPLQPSEKISTELLDSIRAQLPLWFMHNREFEKVKIYSPIRNNEQDKEILMMSPSIKPRSYPKRENRFLRMLLLQHQEQRENLEEAIAEEKARKDTDFAIIKALALQLPLSIQPKTDIELDFIQALGKILKEHSLYAKYMKKTCIQN